MRRIKKLEIKLENLESSVDQKTKYGIYSLATVGVVSLATAIVEVVSNHSNKKAFDTVSDALEYLLSKEVDIKKAEELVDADNENDEDDEDDEDCP